MLLSICLIQACRRLQKLPKKYIKHAAVRLFVIYNRPGYGDAGISEQENIKKDGYYRAIRGRICGADLCAATSRQAEKLRVRSFGSA